jgi:hypothetical protein
VCVWGGGVLAAFCSQSLGLSCPFRRQACREVGNVSLVRGVMCSEQGTGCSAVQFSVDKVD